MEAPKADESLDVLMIGKNNECFCAPHASIAFLVFIPMQYQKISSFISNKNVIVFYENKSLPASNASA